MLQIYTGDILIVGITARNVELLQEDQPLIIALNPSKRLRQIAVTYGVDKPTIIAALEAGGINIPQAVRDAALKDPL